jgi:hypothetical protein
MMLVFQAIDKILEEMRPSTEPDPNDRGTAPCSRHTPQAQTQALAIARALAPGHAEKPRLLREAMLEEAVER